MCAFKVQYNVIPQTGYMYMYLDTSRTQRQVTQSVSKHHGALTLISTPAGTTIGRNDSEWAHIGAMTMEDLREIKRISSDMERILAD